MADKNDKNNSQSLLDSEDYEYEKAIYDKEQQQRAELEAKRRAATEERKRREKEAQKEHERQLAKERLELMKQKGANAEPAKAEENEPDEEDEIENTEQSDEQTETVVKKKSIVKKADNFFYHNKWWIGLSVFIVFVVGFILYNELTKKKPDLTVYMIADNDLELRQPLLEEFFEQYVDDVDDNGYVHVEVQIIPLDRSQNNQNQMDNNTMFLTEIHSTENMLVITDSNTDDYYMEIMDHDLKSKFPDNKYVDERGFSLNMQLVADQLEFEDMPNDVHISIRQPVATVDDSLETAQKNYDRNFEFLKRMIDDLTEKAKKTKDPGLKTQPKNKNESSSQAD